MLFLPPILKRKTVFSFSVLKANFKLFSFFIFQAAEEKAPAHPPPPPSRAIGQPNAGGGLMALGRLAAASELLKAGKINF